VVQSSCRGGSAVVVAGAVVAILEEVLAAEAEVLEAVVPPETGNGFRF
jgi:hypothetical protein